jgi:hypothetical protein
MPQQGLGSDLGSTLVRFNGGVRVNDSVRRRRLSQPCAEQQAQSEPGQSTVCGRFQSQHSKQTMVTY